MKWIILALVTLTAGCASQAHKAKQTPARLAPSPTVDSYAQGMIVLPPERKMVTLTWEYPLEFQTPELVFNVYHSFDITVPLRNWEILKVVPGTERLTVLDAIAPQEFFTLTASNRFGESNFAGNYQRETTEKE